MSHADLMEILETFKKKFPPSESVKDSLNLSTEEITKMILDFHPGIEIPPEGLFKILKELGYTYEPIEDHEEVHLFWLAKRGPLL